MLVTSSIISVAMSQFLSRNLAPPCCGPASSLVSYTERNRVSGFPGGFPPPFQASLLCTARNSANDLCTPNIQPTFRSETAYRGPLDLKYSIQEDFERSLFRKWLEPSQGRKKSAGRISILSAFAISFKVIILIQGVFEVVVQIVKIMYRHFSNAWLNELSITILIVFILFIVHSTYIFFQIVLHHGNFTHLNLLISRILTTLIFLVNLKRLLSHEAIISRDFPDQRFSFSFLSRSDGWKRSRCSQCFPETDHLITQLKFSHDGNNTAGNGGVWSRMAEWPRSSGPRLLDSIIINRMRLSFERTEFEIITLPFQPTNITYTSSSNFSLPLPSLSPVATRSINVITRSLSHETGR